MIQQQELCIRNAENADGPQLAAWWNDGSVMAHAGFPKGLGTTVEKVQGQIAQDRDDTRRRLMLLYKGVAIGEMSYSVLENNAVELGIKICNADFQEHGLGRRALCLVIKELFARGYGKIVLDTNLRNRRAQHVYELIGFQRVGVRENAWMDQVGVMQSAVDYALTPQTFVDWSAKE